MFPDAKLVWIDRDPRAVAYSYVKQQWSKAAAGDTRPEQLQTAANHYLACWHSIEFEPEPLFRLTLERFVSNPSRHMHEILNACDLPSDRKIDAALRRWAIDVRTGWRTALDEQEKGLLQDLLAEPISAGRYD